MDIYFCCNGLGSDPYKFKNDLESATGKNFVMLQWQSKISVKKLKKRIYKLNTSNNLHSKTKQRIIDFFDERDYEADILKPLIKQVCELITKDSKIFFISYSTGSLIVEDIIKDLEVPNINHLLVGSADRGVKWVNPIEKGILVGKLFIPIGLLAIIQTRKLMKHKSKIWLREKLSTGTQLVLGTSRTILSSGKDIIIENIEFDVKRIQNYCVGKYKHSEIGRFDQNSLQQKYAIISSNKPLRFLTKLEIILEFLRSDKPDKTPKEKSLLVKLFRKNR